MSKFTSLVVVEIEARQYLNDGDSFSLLHWINEGQSANGRELADWTNNVLTIPTLEGQYRANIGDWIICGIAGEFYPCNPDIFEATYKAVK